MWEKENCIKVIAWFWGADIKSEVIKVHVGGARRREFFDLQIKFLLREISTDTNFPAVLFSFAPASSNYTDVPFLPLCNRCTPRFHSMFHFFFLFFTSYLRHVSSISASPSPPCSFPKTSLEAAITKRRAARRSRRKNTPPLSANCKCQLDKIISMRRRVHAAFSLTWIYNFVSRSH